MIKRNFKMFPQYKRDMRAFIAEKVLRVIERANGFPYDMNEKRSRDKRKILFGRYSLPHHLINLGSAYVGPRHVSGVKYPTGGGGGYPIGNIFVTFTNPKTTKGGAYDYADGVLKDFLLMHPTETEFSHIAKEAIELYWKAL